MTAQAARKGDLILVERRSRRIYSLAAMEEARQAGRQLDTVTVGYEYGVVAAATRQGTARLWTAAGSSSAQPVGNSRCWVLPAKSVDVAAVLEAAQAHHWPGHPGQPKPFDTFAEAREIARPHATTPAQTA